MRRATGVFLLIGLLWCNLSFGQGNGDGLKDLSQYAQLQEVLNKLVKDVEGIPHIVRRVATQKLAYDSTRITSQGYRLIRHKIEGVFKENGRVKMLQLEEFSRQKVLHVVGTDSTLSLRNTFRGTDERENSIRLLELSQKYGVDAFLKGNIQYRNDVGYVVMLELISPQSREVVWSTSLISKDMNPPPPPSKAKKTLITAGASLMPTTEYSINQTPYTGGEIILLDYSARLTLRQEINSNNSGFVGIRGGYHYFSVLPKGEEGQSFEPYSASIFEVGALFYKTFAPKAELKNDYWLEIYVGPNVLFHSSSNNKFGLAQGININLTENLGFALDAQYFFSETPQIGNEDQTRNLQLNTIGYGLKILLRL